MAVTRMGRSIVGGCRRNGCDRMDTDTSLLGRDFASPKHPARWGSYGVVAGSAVSDIDSSDCCLRRLTLAGARAIINAFVLFLYLLKATLTTFSGFASLPVLRQDLVLNHHVITDQQLNTAIVVTRTTPGPVDREP
jgi:hypothetical protein